MKLKTIKGKERQTFGKSDANKLRDQGLIPCVLYGSDQDNVHFYSFLNDVKQVTFTPDVYKINLMIDGKNYEGIIQDAEFHPITDEVQHIDFLKVDDEKEVTIEIPLFFTGTPKGVRDGGRLFKPVRKLKIKGKVKDIPEHLEIDVSKLRLGASIKVRDLSFPGLTIDMNEEVAIAMVQLPKGKKMALTEEEVEGTEGEPEVSEEGEEGSESSEEEA